MKDIDVKHLPETDEEALLCIPEIGYDLYNLYRLMGFTIIDSLVGVLKILATGEIKNEKV